MHGLVLFGLAMLAGIIIACVIEHRYKEGERTKYEREHVYYYGIRYAHVKDERGVWYTVPDPKYYTKERLASLPINERLRIRSPGLYIPYIERNPSSRQQGCCVCGSLVVSPTNIPGVGLCEKCTQEYVKSKFGSPEFTKMGYDGVGKVNLWMYQTNLAKEVQRNIITEEQAKADMQEVYKYVRERCERRRNEETAEQRAAREKREREAAEKELLDLANHIG